MRIKQISVNGLFGVFDHVIPLNMRDRITIIHAPNGFGKTIILKMLNGFFNSKISIFRTIPFKIFKVDFDDRSKIEVEKNSEHSNGTTRKDKVNFVLHQPQQESPLRFSATEKALRPDVDFPPSILDEIIPGLERIGLRRWRYLPTEDMLSLEEVIDRFEDILPSKIRKSKREPDWLKQARNNIHLRLIESQRLLNTSSRRSDSYLGNSPLEIASTVSQYSGEIADIIQTKLTEYGATSQSLDRTFPARLVQQETSENLADKELRFQLEQLEQKRSRLIEVGLLDKDESSDFQIQTQTIDESTKNILSVYIEDVKKKLSVFDEIASKINLLREIINQKFQYSYKEINFSKEKGFVFTTKHDNKILSPTDLSSGEQHELVLLYELLFKVEPNSLVLIDEPEISLHLGWQVQFLQDLQKITELANIDILMATHSPDIIQDRWDLTVELKGVSQ